MEIKLSGFVAKNESGANLYVLTDNPKSWYVDNITNHHMKIDAEWKPAKITIVVSQEVPDET